MKILTFITLTAIFLNAPYLTATNYFSINDGFGMGGVWSNSGYWSNSSGGAPCGCAPGNPKSTDFVYIQTDMDLDVNVSSSGYLKIDAGKSLQTLVNDLEIKNGGTLVVEGILKVWNLVFYNGSIIEIKPGSQVIVLNNLTNMNNSNGVTVDGDISVTGTFQNGNGGVIAGTGDITATTFTGAGTTFGYTTGDIPPGTTVSEGSLPIELAYFTGKASENKVELTWLTTSEINNDYFTVEKSANGLYFEEIDKIKGSGTSNVQNTYLYTDENPLQGINYYRLRQTDFDGKYSVSEVVSIKFNSTVNPLTFDIFPNPVLRSEAINLNIVNFEPNTEVLMVVVDLLGRELYSKVHITDLTGNTVSALCIGNKLPQGTYLIIGTSLNQTFNKYLVIK